VIDARAHTIEQHTTPDGVRLALHRLGARKRVPVLLVPGTFSNHTFWFGTRGVGFARALVEAGFEACALDPRGHGQSQRPTQHDRWDFDHWARQDVPTVLRSIIAEQRRPFLIGHSAGGAAALIALAANPDLRTAVRGVVIVATPVPWLQPWRGAMARLLRATSRLLGRFPARILRLGPEDELEGAMAQWMSWQLARRWTGDDGTDYEAGLRRLDLPLLAIAATADRYFAPPHACRALYELIESPDKTLLSCGRATTYSEDFNHVSILIGQAARAEVWPKILTWLRQRTPATPDTLERPDLNQPRI
jgi:pimeloyl-ACP methyl ester carboxylesterase